MLRILLVEDEAALRDTLKLNLEIEGYEVITASRGSEVIPLFENQRFELVILDIMLPDMDGLQLCERIRLTNIDTPIIFLTAKDSPADKIQGLKKGADDYLTKPFNLEELLLRITILLRRSQKQAGNLLDLYEWAGNKVNFLLYEAENYQAEKIFLTKKETMLLKLLVERQGEVVSRQQILQTVWGYDVYPSTRTIDNFILSFRKYFEPNPKEPKYFYAIRGVGYKFENGANGL
jgi:two-component system, OmpR family, alkaline phosphatase synthesis response regulator PhoP